jgi:hypothetical protein
MKWFKKNKWTFWWILFGAFVIIFIIYIIEHISKNDFNTALLQFGSILIPLFAAIIIMLQNNEQIDKSTKVQLDHLQRLNDREIDEMQKLFQMQMDSLAESTNRQIEEFRKMTNEQIKSLQGNTVKQIQSNTEQTQKIVDELTDNSVLLAEILKREIEKAILDNNSKIQNAYNRLSKAKSFQLLRTDEDKAKEIKEIEESIKWLEGWGMRLDKKHKQIENIFGDLQ